MEYATMEAAALEARLAEIASENEKDDADLDALEAEAVEIRKELDRRIAEEAKKAEAREAVKNGAGETEKDFEKENKKMTNAEIRNSQEYINAYADYIKTGKDTECRALLTENVSGTVPVPEFVEGIIAEAYRGSKILSRIRKTYAKGNVKVGFEISAPIAGTHVEGSGEMDPENLQLGIVTLVPETLKKYVEMSDESLDSMAGEAYLRYVYQEVMRGIVKAEEKKVIDAILNAPQVATSTAPAVAEETVSAIGLGDFINARALITSDASDLVIICTPSDRAAYRALAISAGFPFDPFDGLTVIENDYATSAIIGDLNGVLGNYPAGDEVQFKYDDRTLMTSDMVRVLGRKPAAIGVVGNLYFAKLTVGGGE